MKVMLYIILVLQLFVSAATGYQFKAIDDTRMNAREETCYAFTRQDDTFVKQIRSGERLATSLTYYKQHPSELKKVLQQDDQMIRSLVPPDYCNSKS